jgi:hypothetical protein
MTDRDELSTADLASQQPSDAAPRHAHDRDADPADVDRADVDRADVDREPPSREFSSDTDDRPVGTEPAGDAAPSAGPGGTSTAGPLLGARDAEGFRARWTDVQTAFVDSPRQSVEQADALVAEVMQHLAKTFADERAELERQWDSGDDIATDELRTAFQRYRSFFERLLAT